MTQHVLAIVGVIAVLGGRAVAICGDCDDDGAVTVDELVTAVNYSLGYNVDATPTPIADFCPDVVPGTRVMVGGAQYIIVETVARFEGSRRRLAVRLPARVGEHGGIYVSEIQVSRRACGVTKPCATGELVSRCGYVGQRGVNNYGTGSYTESTYSGSTRRYWQDTRFAHGWLSLVMDPSYDSLYVSLEVPVDPLGGRDVQSLASYGYSLVNAPYSAPHSDPALIEEQARQLLDFVSIRPLPDGE